MDMISFISWKNSIIFSFGECFRGILIIKTSYIEKKKSKIILLAVSFKKLTSSLMLRLFISLFSYISKIKVNMKRWELSEKIALDKGKEDKYFLKI